MLKLLRTRHINTKSDSLSVKYYLHEPDTSNEHSYGIGVETNGDLKIIYSVLPDKNEVLSLIEALYKYEVTTTTFKDVLEDYVAERNML